MEYKISIDYDDYFANSQFIKASRIEVIGDSIMFYTDKETINLLENKNIRYMLHYSKKRRVFDFVKHKTGIFIGVLVVGFLILMNSFRVSEITFNGAYPINDEIEAYINSQNQNILFFSFHKNNYQDLSRDLRSVFNEYEWITINKKGSKIYVEIEPTTTKDIKSEDNISGDIIASKNAVINEYVIFSGSTIISSNQYITKGSILISGNGGRAKGYVLATVYEQKEIVVSKTNKVSELSGDRISYNQIEVFTKVFDINKKERYNDSTLTKKVIFNIPYLLCVNKIEEYEKNDIIYTYDKESAVKYAATIIEDEFIKNKVLNDEKILRIQELVVIEDEESFKITFLIKKIESIGEFKENV